MPPVFIVAWVMSVAFTLLVGVGVVTYIRRTWQQIQSHEDDFGHDRLLDGIDQLQTQLYIVSERLVAIEDQLRDIQRPPSAISPETGIAEGTQEASIGPVVGEMTPLPEFEPREGYEPPEDIVGQAPSW